MSGTAARHGRRRRPRSSPPSCATPRVRAAERRAGGDSRGLRSVLAAAGVVLALCVAPGRSGRRRRRASRRTSRCYGLAFAAYLVALVRLARPLAPRPAASRSAASLRLARRCWSRRRRCSATTSTATSGRAACSSTAATRTAGRDRPEAPRWQALRDDVWRGRQPQGVHGRLPAAVPARRRAVVGRPRLVQRDEGLPGRAASSATLGLLALLLRRRGLPRERLLVLAWSPLALVEIAGSGHNEAFAHALARAGPARARRRPAAGSRRSPRARASCRSSCRASSPRPGRAATGGGTCSRPLGSRAALVVAVPERPPDDAAQPDEVLAVLDLQRDAVRAARGVARLAPGGGARGRAGHAGASARARLAARRARGGGDGRRRRVAAADARTCCRGTPCGSLPLLVLRDEPAALLFTGTASLAYLVYPAWQSGEPWKIGWGWRALEYGPCLAVAAVSLSQRFRGRAPR